MLPIVSCNFTSNGKESVIPSHLITSIVVKADKMSASIFIALQLPTRTTNRINHRLKVLETDRDRPSCSLTGCGSEMSRYLCNSLLIAYIQTTHALSPKDTTHPRFTKIS
jgi:hypothetical protein